MLKMTNKLPNKEQLRYGQEQYTRGYKKGYDRCTWDLRRRKATKERTMMIKFNSYLDYLEDVLSANRKK